MYVHMYLRTYNCVFSGICQPGLYSTTGLSPCAPCPSNTYQPSYGGTHCTDCPPGTVASNGSFFASNCTSKHNRLCIQLINVNMHVLYFRGTYELSLNVKCE